MTSSKRLLDPPKIAVKIPLMATPNPSLVERKERWARKMAAKEKPTVRPGNPTVRLGRSTERLPPGQHLTQGFPILDLDVKPEIALKDWRLGIGGVWGEYETISLG